MPLLTLLFATTLHAHFSGLKAQADYGDDWSSAPIFYSLTSAAKKPSEVYRLHLARLKVKDVQKKLSALSMFPNLRELKINACGLTEIPPAVFELRNLEELDVEYNLLRFLPGELAKLYNLRKLRASYNLIDSVSSEIGALKKLRGLYLGYNFIRFLPREIGRLTELRVVALNDNELMALPSSIGGWENIETLLINGNRMRQLPDEIGTLKHMRFLHAGGNPFSEETVYLLRSQLPHTYKIVDGLDYPTFPYSRYYQN
ncbi:MAG: leucine-rich repeat domain-containing protein [Bacteroidia bacterium]|nr:leucine-rich repeat domain-containing protein [Bacteroidia bacterium]